jgi:hypothetical protein
MQAGSGRNGAGPEGGMAAEGPHIPDLHGPDPLPVPEFSDAVVPVAGMVLIFIVIRKKRGAK